MIAAERARDYAALFASITASGGNWRLVVPIDGKAHRTCDEALIDGHRIVRREGTSGWDVIAPSAAGDETGSGGEG